MNILAEERRKKYGIPALPYLPMGKNVLVFRLPAETRTAGGLYIAETAQEAKRLGVLVSAGLAALEVLEDHLVQVGDVVAFGRFAGWEDEVSRDPEGKAKRIIEMKVEDVLGSVDALDRVNNYNIQRNEDEQLVYMMRTAA